METKLESFKASQLQGKLVLADIEFFAALERINQFAANNNLTIHVTSSARRQGAAVGGAIVPPAGRSNHLVGHAIDMNLILDGQLFNSDRLGNFSSLPAAIKNFISSIRNDPKLRWGGDFNDPVHIDDGLNIHNPNTWDAKFPIIQQQLAELTQPQNSGAPGQRLLQLIDPLMQGEDVKAIQNALIKKGFNLTADGLFGPQTDEAVTAFQRSQGLTDDGIVGQQTRQALEANGTPEVAASSSDAELTQPQNSGVSGQRLLQLTEPLMQGEDVKAIQNALIQKGFNLTADGLFGPSTDEAVMAFQRSQGLTDDGIVGQQTRQALEANGTPEVAAILAASPLDNLTVALTFTLKWEGGFVDNPLDPGGATNKGVTQSVYNAYRTSKGIGTQSVKLITDAEVHDLYETRYWNPSKAELMTLPLGVAQFDTAVLFGVNGAIKFLQQALNIEADGIFGPQTNASLENHNNKDTALSLVDKRIAFHRQRVASNPSQEVFLQGWLNRANDLKRFISEDL